MKLVANRWYAVLASDEVPADQPVPFRRLGADLVFWRSPAGVHAAVDRCPHRQAKLSIGRLVDGCLECPFHGWRFAADGSCTRVPAHPTRARSGPRSVGPRFRYFVPCPVEGPARLGPRGWPGDTAKPHRSAGCVDGSVIHVNGNLQGG